MPWPLTGKYPALKFEEAARSITLIQKPLRPSADVVVIVTAGTADLPVAMEAKVTAEIMGCSAELMCDVGVAGLHRLLNNLDPLRKAAVVIVVAGMEGALASVVGGLVDCPVIAVPTSVGYGASFEGLVGAADDAQQLRLGRIGRQHRQRLRRRVLRRRHHQ